MPTVCCMPGLCTLEPMKASKSSGLLLFVFLAVIAACTSLRHQVTQKSPAVFRSSRLVTYLTGDPADVHTQPIPGLLLAGGSTDLDSAVKWLLDRSNGGDVVVLRSTESNGYNQYMFDLSKVNSVETIVIDTFSKAMLPEVARKIRNAEALFISGGDQWNYVKFWKDSPVEDAINFLLNEKKVPVGGTSAGLAVLGSAYFSAQNGTVTSSEGLKDPYDSLMTIGFNDFLIAPFMKGVITDSHYTQRDRHGRHIAWIARLLQDHGMNNIKGIGIDEKTAVCIDEHGIGKVVGKNSAYFLSCSGQSPERCVKGQPLTWNQRGTAIRVDRIQGSNSGNGRFNANSWTFTGADSFSYKVEEGVLKVGKVEQ